MNKKDNLTGKTKIETIPLYSKKDISPIQFLHLILNGTKGIKRTSIGPVNVDLWSWGW